MLLDTDDKGDERGALRAQFMSHGKEFKLYSKCNSMLSQYCKQDNEMMYLK